MKNAVRWLMSAIIEKIVSNFALPVALFMLFLCSLCLGGVPYLIFAPILLCIYVAPKLKGLEIDRSTAGVLGLMWLLGCMLFLPLWIIGVGVASWIALALEQGFFLVMHDSICWCGELSYSCLDHTPDWFETIRVLVLGATWLFFFVVSLVGAALWPLASVGWIARLLDDVEAHRRSATWVLGLMLLLIEGPLFLASIFVLKVVAACSC